jgi:polygalacturonase
MLPVVLFALLTSPVLRAGYSTPIAVSRLQSGPINPRQFGARGDGVTKDTAALQQAIDAASAAGGGTVIIPAGRYVCGTIHLKSHIALRLEPGATILGSPDDPDYRPIEKLPYESHSDQETTDFQRALIAGDGLEDVSIEGHGVVDSNRTRRGGPKPIALRRCQGVTIRDVTVQNAPNYSVSLVGCEHVNIDGVTVLNGYADGIDPDCCRYVRISNCAVDSHDDAICLKSSLALGKPMPTEFVTVTNCIMRTDCNGFKMGTESSGAFKSVTVSNCDIASRPDHKEDTDAGIALETTDGAEVERIAVSNITIKGMYCPIFIRLGNRGRGQNPPVPGYLRDVRISNIVAQGAAIASSIAGLPDHPVEEVAISDITVSRPADMRTRADLSVPESGDKYPDPDMYGPLPASGLYCRHVRGLTLRGLVFDVMKSPAVTAVVMDDVSHLFLSDLTVCERHAKTPAVWLNSCQGWTLRDVDTQMKREHVIRLTGGSRGEMLK